MTHFTDSWVVPALVSLADWSIRWGLLVALMAAWWAVRPPKRASERHLLLSTLLVAGILLPFLPRWGAGFVRVRGEGPEKATASAPPPIVAPRPEPAPRLPEPVAPPPIVVASPPPAPSKLVAPRVNLTAPPSEPWDARRVAWLALAGLWGASVVALLSRLVVGRAVLARLRRTAVPVGESAARKFDACRQELGLRRRAGLAAHDEVGSPVAIGGLNPLVLVPADWDALPEAVQRAGLLHELAHLKHYDDWARLGQEVFRAFAAFHPAVHWVLARLDRERELLCDEAAISRGVDPRDFARMLLDFSRRPRSAIAPAVALPFLRPGTVKDRIHRLLEDDLMRRISPLSTGRSVAVGLTTLAITLGLGSLRVGADDGPKGLAVAPGFPDVEKGAKPIPEAKMIEAPKIVAIKQENQVLAAAYSADGALLATVGNKWKYQAQGQSGELNLWDAKTGKLVRTITIPEMGLGNVAFSPDRKTVAATVGGGEVRLWDAATGTLKRSLEVTVGLAERLEALAFSPDGKTLAAAGSHGPLLYGQGGYIQLWDVNSGNALGVLDRGTVGVASIAFSPDGQTLASGGGSGISGGEIALWDWHASKEQLEAPFGMGRVGRVKAVMDFNQRKPKTEMGSNAHVISVAFSPDGKTLAAGGFVYDGLEGDPASAKMKDMAGQVSLYDAKTGTLIRSTTRHEVIYSASFSPDGRKLLVTTTDDKAELWDIPSGDTSHTLPGKYHLAQGAFSPDGRAVAIGDANGNIHLVPIAVADEARKDRGPAEAKLEDEGVHIQGHVVDDQTGKPVSRFIVQDGRVDPKDPKKIVWGFSEGRITSPNPEGLLGNATIHWDRGNRIRVLAEGYLPQPVLDGPPAPGTRELDITVRLKRGREIVGRVVDAEGKPVAGAGVFLVGNRNVNLTGGQAIQAFVGGVDKTVTRAETDADGRFTLTGGGDDANVVAVSARGLDLWAVPAPKAGEDLEVRLPKPGTFLLRYEIDGAPPEGKFLLQFLREGLGKDWQSIENLRNFSVQGGATVKLGNLTPGSYDISRVKELRVGSMGRTAMCDRRKFEVRAGENSAIELVRREGSSLSGRVVGLDDLKLEGAFVYVRSPDATGRPGDFDDFQKPFYDGIATGPDGRFTTERLAPGDYAIIVHAYKPPPPDEDGFNRRRFLGGGLQLPDYIAGASVVVKAGGHFELAPITLKPYAPADVK